MSAGSPKRSASSRERRSDNASLPSKLPSKLLPVLHQRFSSVSEERDRTGYVAAGGSPLCACVPGWSCQSRLHEKALSVSSHGTRPRLESFLQGTQVQKTATVGLELLLDGFGVAGPFVNIRA